MLNIKFGAGAIGAGTGKALYYGSGFTKMMRLLAAPATQHCTTIIYFFSFILIKSKICSYKLYR
jgi:hypothetical protein